MGRDYRSNPGRLRRPGLQGALVVDTTRGAPRVRAWPRKRGKPKSVLQQDGVDWFKDATDKAKRADPEQIKIAMTMTKKTGLYPRDLLLMAMAGNLGPFERDDGLVLQKKRRDFATMIFQGCILNLDAPLALPSGNSVIDWPLPLLDTADFWSAANPSRITNTAGFPIIGLVIAGFFADPGGSFILQGGIRLNGDYIARSSSSLSSSINGTPVTAGPILLQDGDYLEADISLNTGKTLNAGPANFFSLVLLDDQTFEGS